MNIIDYICHLNEYIGYNLYNKVYIFTCLLLCMFNYVTKIKYQGSSIFLLMTKRHLYTNSLSITIEYGVKISK